VKNKEMERLAAASAGSGRQLSGDVDALAARVVILHNNWRTVWRLSVDRKKLLQDTFDHLLEVSQCCSVLCSTVLEAASALR